MLLVVSGRPLALEWAAEHCAAVLLAWVPGEAGPAAIAEVLAGDAEPGGRLPITVPRHVGQVPLTYRHHPTGGRSNWKIDYVDGAGRAAVAVRPRALVHDVLDRGACGSIAPRSTPTGDEVVDPRRRHEHRVAAGDEVVQLYVRDEEATVARPVIELRGFRRVRLEPGECRTVAFRLSDRAARVHRRRLPAGGRARASSACSQGRSSADLPLSAELTLTGPTVELVERTRYLTEATDATPT